MFSLKMITKLSNLLEPNFLGFLVFSGFILIVVMLMFLRKRSFIEQLSIIYFFICFFIIALDYFKPLLPLQEDSTRYYIPTALGHAKEWRYSIIASIFTFDIKEFIFGRPAYIYPLSLVFYLFNDSLQAARLFSSIFGILTIFALYKLVEELYDTRTAKFATILLAASPYYLFISCSILRETMTLFFLIWFFRLWMLYDRAPSKKGLLLMLFALLYAGLSRPALMLVLVVVVTIYKTGLNFEKKNLLITRIIKIGIVTAAFIFISVNISADSSLTQVRIVKGLQYADLDQMISRAQRSGEGDSGYTGEFKYTNYYEAFLYCPILSMYFMCSPFPWMVKKNTQLLALMDSSVLWVLYIFFFLEIKSFWRRNRKWASILFTYLFIGIIGASLIQGNMGAAVRHRLMFTLIILPFAAHNILKRFVKQRNLVAKENALMRRVRAIG
jgi:4-amino-4-deoxy-L-arabinose transferase-like glycosyltransferase